MLFCSCIHRICCLSSHDKRFKIFFYDEDFVYSETSFVSSSMAFFTSCSCIKLDCIDICFFHDIEEIGFYLFSHDVWYCFRCFTVLTEFFSKTLRNNHLESTRKEKWLYTHVYQTLYGCSCRVRMDSWKHEMSGESCFNRKSCSFFITYFPVAKV